MALLCLDVSTSGLQTEEFVVRELHDHICAAEIKPSRIWKALGRTGMRRADQSAFFQWSTWKAWLGWWVGCQPCLTDFPHSDIKLWIWPGYPSSLILNFLICRMFKWKKKCTQSNSTVLGSINISYKKEREGERKGGEGEGKEVGEKEKGEKKGKEREKLLNAWMNLGRARELICKLFSWFLT